MKAVEKQTQPVIQGEDIARWLTFSSFWGSIFYILAIIGLVAGQRRQPVRLHAGTALLGMAVHVGTFVTVGSGGGLAASLARGQSTSQQARERIDPERLERGIVRAGASGALGSVIPFVLALGSLQVAERLTGQALFEDADTSWPRAVGTTAVFTGLTALAVSRIAAWVARDAAK